MSILVFLMMIIGMALANTYNLTDSNVGNGKGPYCWADGPGSTAWTDCMDSCPKPSSGATCDIFYEGVNIYYCCHEPLPGCFSNSNDAKSHCSTKKVTEVDEKVWCCIDDCCQSSDKSCDAGNVCCYSDCNDPMNPDCSYTESTCNGSHGDKNDCMWDSKNDMCVVGL